MSADEGRKPGHKSSEVDVVGLPTRGGSWRIWVLFLAGPTIWFLHFSVVYLAAEWLCKVADVDGRLLGLPAVSALTVIATLIAVAVILALAVPAYRRWRTDEPDPAETDDPSAGAAAEGHDRALMFAGFILGLLFALAVLMVGLPAVWLQPC